jgi:hypothetical protein
VATKWFHVDRRTDGHGEANSSFLQYCERAYKLVILIFLFVRPFVLVVRSLTALVVAMVFCTTELRVFIVTIFFFNVNCLLVQGNYQHFCSFC